MGRNYISKGYLERICNHNYIVVGAEYYHRGPLLGEDVAARLSPEDRAADELARYRRAVETLALMDLYDAYVQPPKFEEHRRRVREMIADYDVQLLRNLRIYYEQNSAQEDSESEAGESVGQPD